MVGRCPEHNANSCDVYATKHAASVPCDRDGNLSEPSMPDSCGAPHPHVFRDVWKTHAAF